MKDQDHDYFGLVEQLIKNRSELQDMIIDLKEFRKNLDILLPKKLDYRHKFLMEERMKAVTSILATELAIRKSIDSSLRTEFEFHRKGGGDEDEVDDARTLTEALAAGIADGTIKLENKH